VADRAEKPCLKILDLLPRFIEDDFSPQESEDVREHLADCEGCLAEYEAMRCLVDTLETVPTLDVPAPFKEAVMRHLPAKPEKP
jgi:hypothetical protein